MALFKILRGESSRIDPTITPFHDGYAYLTPDDGGFYIDVETGGEQKRIHINSLEGVARLEDLTSIYSIEYTLDKNNWGNNTQTLYSNYITANINGILSLSPTASEEAKNAAAMANLNIKTQDEGFIAIEALDDIPTIDLPIILLLYNATEKAPPDGDREYATINYVDEHLEDTNNPHGVTAAQVGAATTSALTSHTGNKSNPHAVTASQVGAATTSALTSHTGNKSNPHAVTASQVGAATTALYTATLTASGWTGSEAPYTQALTITGLLDNDTPFVDITQTGTEETDGAVRSAWGVVTRMVATTDMLTAYASAIPEINIPIQVKVVK